MELVRAIALLIIVAACSGSGHETEVDAGANDSGDDAASTADASDADAGASVEQLVGYVDPFIGTDDSNSPHPVPGGAGGSTYPGAVVPFGMVQLSPDTPTASPSGYRASDREIEQFSVTHFDGAGCANNEDIPFIPFVGDLATSPGSDWSSYRSRYSKTSEQASPGYYAVHLEDPDVNAELTTTTRTGFARFTFPAASNARLLMQTGLSATGARLGSVEVVAPDRIQGTVTAGGFCGTRGIFRIRFVAVFDTPSTGHGTWVGDQVTDGSSNASGLNAGVYLTFDTTEQPVVQMKIALSYISIDNAEANLEAEIPDWDFSAVRTAASSAWNTVLNRVRVSGGSTEDRTKFYTALYHVFQSPNVASDVNGQYLGFDGAVHTADGWTMYQNFSGWDIIRSWTHLMGAIAPEMPDIVRSMVQDGVHSGLLPFWTHQTVEARVMVGDPGTVNVANAYAMGVRGFDTTAALALMKRSADDPTFTQRYALRDWLENHYAGNAAVSLEYAMADFALAMFAQELGDAAAYARYLARSAYWHNSWNAADGYIEPRVGTPSAAAGAARIYELQVYGPDSPSTNLALDQKTDASGSCNADETPDKTVNGSWTGGSSDKWCDNTSANKWLQVDLGSVQSLERIVIHHAGAGGEGSKWNTQDFRLRLSIDGGAWTTVADVKGNSANVTTHDFDPIDARYVRLEVETPIQLGTPGDWDCQPFDPGSMCGFIEGNGAQYVWMVPHDLEGLFSAMGGHESAVARLDELFTELNAGTKRPYFYIGNEPEHGTPWTYVFAGAPPRTQEVVARIIDQEFNTSSGGLPGNDDLGATSAWLVWAYLGLYPMIPGTDVLVMNGPRFASTTVTLANGKTLTITGDGAGTSAPYVQALNIDGTASDKSWLRFRDIASGATLAFTMGSAPNPTWGAEPSNLPPSFPAP